MWREEAGIVEMLLAYIGEFSEFNDWTSWRRIVIDILSCHEQTRLQSQVQSLDAVGHRNIEEFTVQTTRTKEEPRCSLIEGEKTMSSILPRNNDTEIAFRGLQTMHGQQIRRENADGSRVDSSSFDDLEIVRIDIKDDDEAVEEENTGEVSIINMDSELDEGRRYGADNQMKSNIDGDCTDQVTPLNPELILCERNSPEISIIDSHSSNLYLSSVDYQQVEPVQEDEFRNKCHFCFKRFVSHHRRIIHERIHTGEKPYHCSFCSKSFNQKSTKKIHERLHTGEKPFPCSFCPKAFTSQSHRRAHERSHTGKKPYLCSFCSKRFSYPSLKMKHELSNCCRNIQTFT